MALAGLGLLAAIALLLSAFAPLLKWPLAGLALGRGAQLARREWRRRPRVLELESTGDAMLMLAGGRTEPVHAPVLALRGALASLRWRDRCGVRRALHWAPDTLPPASRRQLHLRLGGAAP